MADSSSFFNFYRSAEKARPEHLPWFIKLIQTLLLILFMTLLTDLGIVMFVPDGLQMLKDAYNDEIRYLSANIDLRATEFISRLVDMSYNWVFIKTGIYDYLYSGGNQLSSSLIVGMWPLMQGVMIGFQIFMIRLSVLILMLPFLLLMMVVAAADGYLEWYRRRTGGARESGFIYHRSKSMVTWAITGLWFFYLIPPFAVDPIYVFIPTVFLLTIFTRLTIQFFKKYV